MKSFHEALRNGSPQRFCKARRNISTAMHKNPIGHIDKKVNSHLVIWRLRTTTTHKNPIPLAMVAIRPKMKQPVLITIVCLASEICIEAAAEMSTMSMCGLRLVVHTTKHSNFRVQNYSVYRMGLPHKIRIVWNYFLISLRREKVSFVF